MKSLVVLTCVSALASLPALAVPAASAQKAAVEIEYGDAWAELGNHERAAGHYRKAAELQPGSIRARLSLANTLYRLGQKQDALSELERLVARDPKSEPVLCALGVIQLDLGEPGKACSSFDRALSLAPAHERAMFGRGQCHHALFRKTRKQPEKRLALQAYRAYLERHAQGAHAIPAREAVQKLMYGAAGRKLSQAKESFAKGKYRLSEKLLRDVVTRRPDLQEAHFLLGMTLASPVINKIDEAEQAWRRAGKMPEALVQRGILAYEEDDLEQASDLLREAVQLDASNPTAYYYLGLVQRGLLQEEQAKKAFQKVMALAPGTPLAERASSKLQVMTGQLQYLREGETIDTASEIALGRKITGQIEQRFGLVEDQELQKRLNVILRNIARHADRPPGIVPYRVKVLDMEGINALSFVGGTIYVYRGLVDFIRREMDDADDAYAAVLSHEVVHVVRRHGLGMLDLIGGSRSLMEGRSFDVRSLNKLMVGMSRIHEYEADHIGCLYMYRAGYDPGAAYRFHRAMLAGGKEVPAGMDHPTHAERADRLREYLLGLRTKARHFDRGLRALDEERYQEAVTHFEIFLGLFPGSWAARNNLGVAMHRLALATTRKKRTFKLSTDIDPRARVRPIRLRAAPDEGPSLDEALMTEAAAVLRTVTDEAPGYVPARQNYGSCLLALGKHDQARKVFEQILTAKPDAPAVRSNLAVATLLAGEADRGISMLEKLHSDHPAFADALYNLALAYQRAGRKQQARKTWLAYLERDDQSGWAASARKHLADLD